MQILLLNSPIESTPRCIFLIRLSAKKIRVTMSLSEQLFMKQIQDFQMKKCRDLPQRWAWRGRRRWWGGRRLDRRVRPSKLALWICDSDKSTDGTWKLDPPWGQSGRSSWCLCPPSSWRRPCPTATTPSRTGCLAPQSCSQLLETSRWLLARVPSPLVVMCNLPLSLIHIWRCRRRG